MNPETNCIISIYKNQIILSDSNSFIAYMNIEDLLKILIDERFYKALVEYESKTPKIMSIEPKI